MTWKRFVYLLAILALVCVCIALELKPAVGHENCAPGCIASSEIPECPACPTTLQAHRVVVESPGGKVVVDCSEPQNGGGNCAKVSYELAP